jgi:hypothetical protein
MQLAELVEHGSSRSIEIVDVGGDILAEGHEPTLRSPLADALTLAATTNHHIPVRAIVVGPGVDGELDAATMGDRLRATGATFKYALSEGDAELVAPSLEWHPSEATILALAAARGVRGQVEIHTEGQIVELTAASAEVYSVDHADALAASTAAKAVLDSTSLAHAEDSLRDAIGFTELDFERSKAERRRDRRGNDTLEAAIERVRTYLQDAATRGVTYVTFRRLAEVGGLTALQVPALRRILIGEEPQCLVAALWAVG